MKYLLTLLICVTLSLFAQAQETFPISPIGKQRVFVGAKITTTLSAVNHDLTNISLISINLPPFGHFQDLGKGFGQFTFEPDAGDIGTYEVTLQATGASTISTTTFQVTVEALPNGNQYYVDPVNGDNSNPGTSTAPWKTLQEVFQTGKNIKANDVLFLRSGNHKDPVVNQIEVGNAYILAEKGASPMFEKLNFYLAKNWVLSGVQISPEANNTTSKGNYVRIQSNCSNITIENCEIYGTSDVMNWTTVQDWYDHAGDGILIEGLDCSIRNNYIHNIYFGLTAKGSGHEVAFNLMDNYGADGFRGLGNDCKYLYNRIQNALVDDYATGNHDDGFQSWATNGPVKNVLLKGNQIFSHTDPSLPLKTSVLQGLVNFDGFSENWVVEDNLVAIDHPHGLTLLGAKNCKVVNNTVINNPLELFPYGNPPWIRIGAHKNGAKSTGNLNRNNLMAFNYLDGNPSTFDHNLIANNDAYFVNYAHWNFHLKAQSAPINGGTKEDGSTLDNAQHIRADSFPDVGCYEYLASTFDFHPPNPISDLMVISQTASTIQLAWTVPDDNIKIKNYYFKVKDQTIITDSTKVIIKGLFPNETYTINYYTEDLAGLFSAHNNLEITQPPAATDTILLSIGVRPEDQMIQNTKEQKWIDLSKHAVGGYTFAFDASAVLPFKLPSIPSGYTVKEAKLSVNLERVVNNPKGFADLYAIAVRQNPSVNSADHWQGTFGNQSFGVPVQEAYLDKDIPLGITSTNNEASAMLSNYINDNYSPLPSYLFLRLNSDQTDESNYRFYEFSSGNHSNTFWRPTLDLVLVKPLALKHIDNKNISIYPNPCTTKEIVTIQWEGNILKGSVTIKIHNSLGQLIHSYSSNTQNNRIQFKAHSFPASGNYYITIQDKVNFVRAKIAVF